MNMNLTELESAKIGKYGLINGITINSIIKELKDRTNGYISIVSKNDTGKSTILQILFAYSASGQSIKWFPAERLGGKIK